MHLIVRWHEILLRDGYPPAISLIVGEEKCLVFAAIDVRDGYGTSQAAAKRVESLGRLGREVQDGRVQRVVLQVLKQAAVKLVGSTLGNERNVGHLGKFRAVVECRDFEFGEPFGGWVGVYKRAVASVVRGRNSVDGITGHGIGSATDLNIALTIGNDAGGKRQRREWTGSLGPEVQRHLDQLIRAPGVADRRVLRVDLLRRAFHTDRLLYLPDRQRNVCSDALTSGQFQRDR